MIVVNILKAKNIAHDLRRQSRAAEFEPYDAIIMKQIPGQDLAQAELARQQIREKYAQIQINIDSCSSVDDLTNIVSNMQ